MKKPPTSAKGGKHHHDKHLRWRSGPRNHDKQAKTEPKLSDVEGGDKRHEKPMYWPMMLQPTV